MANQPSRMALPVLLAVTFLSAVGPITRGRGHAVRHLTRRCGPRTLDHMVEQLHSFGGRVSSLAHQVGQIGRRRVAPADSVQEPCISCGEETAVGSVFFSDRLKIPRYGRPDAFLCVLCDAKIRASHKPPRLTEEEVANLTRNASATAITWWSHF